MNRYYYDLHIHSCLSPCADNDNTPANLVGVAVLAGLNIMALTDHNTAKNCPAFFAAAKKQGVIAVAGMELTTAEDIHLVCLFENLSDAMIFDKEVEKRRVLIKNRVDIFGEQLLMDENDNVIGNEEFLLSNATNISIDEAPELVQNFGGVCYPAHVDREANGVIATLGTFPETPFFGCAEFHNQENIDNYTAKFPVLKTKPLIVSSDAHYLWDIRDKTVYFELDDEPYSSERIRKELFKILRGE